MRAGIGLMVMLVGLPAYVLAAPVPVPPAASPDAAGVQPKLDTDAVKTLSEQEQKKFLCFEDKKKKEQARVQALKDKNSQSMDGAKQELQNPTQPKSDEELKKECEETKLEETPAEPATTAAKDAPAADKPTELPKAVLEDKPAAPEAPAAVTDKPQLDLPGLDNQNLPGMQEGQNLGEMLRQALEQKAQNDQKAAENEERYPNTDREVRDRCAQAGYPSETLLRQLAQWDARNDKAMDPCFVNDAAYVAAYSAAKQPKPTTPSSPVAPEDVVNGVNASNAAVLRLCNAGVLEAVKGLDLQGVAPEVGFKKDTELTLTEKNLLAAKPAVATDLQQTMQRFQAGVRNALTNVTLPVSDTLVKDQAYQQGQLCAPKLKAGQ